MKKLIVFLILYTIVVLLFPEMAFAQPGGGGLGGNPPCDGPFASPTCPIDGGLSFLIAAGLAFGGKKANDLRKRNQH